MALYRFGWVDPTLETIDDLEKKSINDHNSLVNNGGNNSHAAINNHISSLSAHGTSSDIVGENDNQILTNKTISASDNTVLIPIIAYGDTDIRNVIDQKLLSNVAVNFGSVSTIASVIAGINVEGIRGIFNEIYDTMGTNTTTVNGVNPLTTDTYLHSNVNQDVRSTSSPAFVSETLSNQLTLNTGAFHPIIINQSSNTSGNDILFQKSAVNIFGIGTNESTTETFTWTFAPRDYKIGTNNTERLRIPSGGISNNNAITNILGINGTTLVYKNDIVDASTSQTFTNKQIDSSINTITITNSPLSVTNINSLINQDLRTTASPSFVTLNSTNQANIQTTNTSGIIINQALNLAANTNGIAIQSGGITKLFIGHNQSTDQSYLSSTTSLRLLSGSSQRILIDTAGLINITSGGGISLHVGGNTSFTFVGKADLGYSSGPGSWFTSAATGDINLRNTDTTRSLNLGVGSSTAQLQLSNTVTKNVITSIDDYTNNTTKARSTFPISTTSAAGVTTTLLTIPIPTNSSIAVFMYLSTRKLSGTITGYGSYIFDWKAINNAGTVTSTNGSNQAKSEQSVAGAFAGKITPSVSVSTTNLLVNLGNTFVDGILTESGYIEVLFS